VDLGLRDRVCVVTGSTEGIGLETARLLAEEGARVVTCGRRDAAPDVGEALHVACDLSRPEAPAELVARAEREVGPVDVLVNNVGFAEIRDFDELTEENWADLWQLNVMSYIRAIQAVLPGMRERGFGRILFTSSVAALTGGIVGPHYASSKAGLHGLTHFLAPRVASDGVTVNAIAPALIEQTGMLPGDPGELAGRVPVGRLGRPSEVADLALAVLRNGYVTNQVISIDGGIHPG
jgi:3-oxoacyl-[acyl-carrier protein] reductase